MKKPPTVLWAILAKDGSKVLDFFFECLLAQDFPLNQVFLFIRTNDNNDDTDQKIATFISTNKEKFLGIHLNNESVNPDLKKYAAHEWNVLRLEILGKIRQESVLFASEHEFDFYFTCDVDNFILPSTLKSLIDLDKQAVAPLLKMVIPENPKKSENSLYSTFQDKMRSHDGAFLMTNRTKQIASLSVRGVFEVDLIHCTYLVRRDVFQSIDFLFQKNNYEYRNFALSLRKNGIPQFVDARKVYGCLTLSERVDLARKLMTKIQAENEAEPDFSTTTDHIDSGSRASAVLSTNDTSSRESIFDEIYRNSGWGEMSGPGSDPRYARYWIDMVNAALSLPEINSVLDIGSGDWRLGSNYNLIDKSYEGLEVSKEAIRISEKYTSTRVNFVFGDAEKIPLSTVDLILVKDVLQHLPFKSIQIILERVFAACKFALICNDFLNSNADTLDGGWRALNLNEKPFNCRLIEVGSFGKVNRMQKRVYLYVSDSIKGTDYESEMLVRLGLDSRFNG
jgi:SAM-dependent methyltransferase